MKQILFLLLLPCFAMAQYPGNANQKITLGEQTSADGLVYRGVASIDTATATSKITRANKQDTSTFILLDTVTNLLWHYKTTSNRWLQAGGSTLDTATMLLPYWRSGRFSGVLPVANGGTGSETKNFVDLTTAQTISGNKTLSDSILVNNKIVTTSAVNGGGFYMKKGSNINSKTYLFYNDAYDFGDFGISQEGVAAMLLLSRQGFFGINIFEPSQRLDVNGNARIRGLANSENPVNVQVDANGVLVRTSSINIKEDVQNLSYGLDEIMLLQPSKFSYIDKYKYGEGYDIGFIAEDVNNVIPEAVGTGVESDVFMDSVKLIPVLVKAIQEQQALIKALEQRILILENK